MSGRTRFPHLGFISFLAQTWVEVYCPDGRVRFGTFAETTEVRP